MKSSFVLYTAYMAQIELLNMEQRGTLLTAIMSYSAWEELPEMDSVTQMAFAFIKADLDRDAEKYQKTCDARKEAGKLGGRPKANGFSEKQTKAKKPNGFSEKQKNPDNEYEYDNEYDSKDNISASKYPYKEVIDYLNARAGTKFKDKSKDTRSHIRARIDEGFTVDDFKKVIDGRIAAWKGDAKMNEFIRPSTLFGPKFESYLNAKPIRLKPKNTFNNFEQRDYDFAELERQLTGVV